jgi:hypothetical protein
MDRRGKVGSKSLSLGGKMADCEFSSRIGELELEAHDLVEI